MESQRLRELLLAELGCGRLAGELILPALKDLGEGDRPATPLRRLHDELLKDAGNERSARIRLAKHVEMVAIDLARKSSIRGEACPDLDSLFLPKPRDFVRRTEAIIVLGEFMRLSKDRRYANRSDLPQEVKAAVDKAWQASKDELETLPIPWGEADVSDLVYLYCESGSADDESADFLERCLAERPVRPALAIQELTEAHDTSESRAEKEALLDHVLSLQSELAVPFLIQRFEEGWARLRISVALAHRFPRERFVDADGVLAWLVSKEPIPTGLHMVTDRVRVLAHGDVSSRDFIRRWSEKDATLEPLLRRGARASHPLIPPIPQAPPEPVVPKGPSVWATHVRPFFADNWYIFAGLLMLVVGCSIIASYTWDRHWLWRYTLLPALLGVFTFALAGLGNWIENQSDDFRGTAASLRAAAIGLLPINFMTVAFLAVDPQIESKGLLTSIAAALYLGLFGWGLRRWCRSVFPPIASLLGAALLLINGLVVLRPLAVSLPETLISPANIPAVIGTGFYLGFAAIAGVILVFGRRHLTRELADDKVVPWFVGGTLLATFVQVMAWVHASLGSLPQVHTYAAMVVMAGGLLLFAERRVQALDKDTQSHRSESFLGFTLVLLGCLMGQADEVVRVLVFSLSGAVWLYQARGRGHQAHQWIGLILISLAVASVGLIEGFPTVLRPLLGFVLAAAFVPTRLLALGRGDQDLASAARGMRDAVLLFGSMIAVIGQWNDHSQPWIAAAYLGANALLFAWLAHREQRLQLLHTTMLLVAMILPYAGCVDIEGRSLHGNTMVFGIAIVSILWLLQNRLRPTGLTLRARSTVLWFYGALAVVGMVLRVLIERGTPGDVLWYRQAMDYSGPLLMALVLVFATWFSRSLVPAIMAAVIVIILFPELKARFETTFSQLGWGTGIGSSINALVLCVICFALRRWSFLRDSGAGDRLLGAFDFPLRRFDHTLFTWPLLASSLFLVSRTETWTLYINLAGNMSAQTAWAIVIAGATWTCLSAYGRKHLHAQAALYLGCLSFGAGFFLLHWQVAEIFTWHTPTLWTLLLLQALHAGYTSLVVPRHEWARSVLVQPTNLVLRVTSVAIGVALIRELSVNTSLSQSPWLVAFVTLRLLWDAFYHRSYVAASLLFILTFVSVPAGLSEVGRGWVQDFDWATHATPIVLYLLVLQALHLLPENRDWLWRRSLVLPMQIGSCVVAGILSLVFLNGIVETRLLTTHASWLLLVTLALQARAWRFAGLLILSLSLAYLWICASQLGFGQAIIAPWRTACFALALILIHGVGKVVHSLSPRLIVPHRAIALDLRVSRNWLLGMAAALAVFSTLTFVIQDHWRADRGQLAAPYLGTMALISTAFVLQKKRLLYLAVFVFTVGNVQIVRLLAGAWLLDQGLSELHLVCLGMATTLAVVAGIRGLAKKIAIRDGMDRASMLLAGATLLLISTNYLIRHSLEDITSWRFLASGLLSYGAALVFRRVSRIPGRSASLASISSESAYHFGVTIALWCAALLIPVLRQPNLALVALSLPVFWFVLRADLTLRSGSELFRPYRNSAVTLGILILGLYVFRAAFQLILFPDTPIQSLHYHTGSPVILLIGLALLRLHALGSGYWIAFYGGLAVMVASFFAVTSFPALRPFEEPMAGAAAALLLTHFWTLVTTQQSPLRTVIQRLGGISTEDWDSLRTTWGLTLLGATQVFVTYAVIDSGDHPAWVAPLLLLAASVLFHHGYLRQIPWYLAVGAVEVLLAIHADFWVESWLNQNHVVWVLLTMFLCGVGLSWYRRERSQTVLPGLAFGTLAAIMGFHVFHHEPWSTVALWTVTLLAVMALALPQRRLLTLGTQTGAACTFWLMSPIWLAYFSQVTQREGMAGQSHPDLFAAWPALCGLSAALAVATFAWACARPLQPLILARGTDKPCLIHQILHICSAKGEGIFIGVGGLVALLAGLLQLAHYGRSFDAHSFALLCLLWSSLVWLAWTTARLRSSGLAFAVMELCVVALFLLVRRQLQLTTELWSPNHDVWSSLIAATLLVGMARSLERQVKAFVIPLTLSILALPALALSLTLLNGLGTNVALFVVGLHSLLFSYMGKDNRESPYHILAVTGFVSFVMVVFWSKLELRSLQAYVLPVGLGILCLLQLFRSRIAAPQRNGVRLVTVLAMLLSCAWYAILDVRHPVGFNLTLLLIAVAAMLLGGFLRIRIYMTLGIMGVFVSLGSIMYRILTGLERGSRMTLVGLLVVVTGAALVAGAIYYKTHSERINGRLDALRKKFGDWE